MNNENMRSPLGGALGLGSAKTGVEQWWRVRVSALALVPLTVWFAASLIVHTGSDYATFIAWLRTPMSQFCWFYFYWDFLPHRRWVSKW